MEVKSQFIERRIYSLELRHQVCKEHLTAIQETKLVTQ